MASLGTNSPTSDSHQAKLLPACVMAQGHKPGDGIWSGICPLSPSEIWPLLACSWHKGHLGGGIPHKQPLAGGWKHQLSRQRFFSMTAWACSAFKATGSPHPGWRTQGCNELTAGWTGWFLLSAAKQQKVDLGWGCASCTEAQEKYTSEVGFCKIREAVSSAGG